MLLKRATRWSLRNSPRPLDIACGECPHRTGRRVARGGGGTTCSPLPTAMPRAARPKSWLPRAFRRSSPVASGSSKPLLAALDLVEVATATGVGFEEAAGVYFAIDDRLELHSLRALICALPREERWEALALRALWEDLQGEHRALTVDVLRESEAGLAAERLSALDRAQRGGGGAVRPGAGPRHRQGRRRGRPVSGGAQDPQPNRRDRRSRTRVDDAGRAARRARRRLVGAQLVCRLICIHSSCERRRRNPTPRPSKPARRKLAPCRC